MLCHAAPRCAAAGTRRSASSKNCFVMSISLTCTATRADSLREASDCAMSGAAAAATPAVLAGSALNSGGSRTFVMLRLRKQGHYNRNPNRKKHDNCNKTKAYKLFATPCTAMTHKGFPGRATFGVVCHVGRNGSFGIEHLCAHRRRSGRRVRRRFRRCAGGMCVVFLRCVF